MENYGVLADKAMPHLTVLRCLIGKQVADAAVLSLMGHHVYIPCDRNQLSVPQGG